MGLRLALVVGVLVSASLAGCSGGSEAPQGQEEDLTATHGTVMGLVTDDEARPVSGVQVALKTVKVSPIALKILTNSEGRFRLEAVPAGKQTVIAVKEGYDEASTTITVVPGAETNVRLVLRDAPIKQYKVVPLASISGFYTCGIELVLSSGECEYEVKNQTGQDPAALSDNNATFDVPSGWGGLLFEVTWTIGCCAETVQGIRFQLESQEDLGGMFVKANGIESPLRIPINAGQVAPDATLGYPIPQRGVNTWIHVLPLGHFEGGTCTVQCGYGVGAALSIDYEIFITIFYGGPVDPNYSSFA